MELDFIKSESHPVRIRIKQLNYEYLLLAKDVCTHDPAAAVTLGLPPEVVSIIAGLERKKIRALADVEVLLALPRIKSVANWREVVTEQFDSNHLMRILLTEA